MSQAVHTADALARGLAQHVQRWASARGAAPDAAHVAACAAQALSLATGLGHVCVWLADLPRLTATLPEAIGANLPGQPAAWCRLLRDSRVVGSARTPDQQPLVLDDDGRLYL